MKFFDARYECHIDFTKSLHNPLLVGQAEKTDVQRYPVRKSRSLPLTGKAYGKAGLKSPTPKLKTTPAPGESGVSPELVREQLHKIVASRTFRKSKRLVRFLSFIVERAILGQGDQIHEHLIGVEVYERQHAVPRAKTLCVDDRVSIVGSARSVRRLRAASEREPGTSVFSVGLQRRLSGAQSC